MPSVHTIKITLAMQLLHLSTASRTCGICVYSSVGFPLLPRYMDFRFTYIFCIVVLHAEDGYHPSPPAEKRVIQCIRCGEPCKGEVLRVHSSHFHVRCFTCKGEWFVQMWAGGVSDIYDLMNLCCCYIDVTLCVTGKLRWGWILWYTFSNYECSQIHINT